ncbi:TetR/AcrR family transcriptional regulator [Chelatococcus composti]|jgi:AcrR family transcriptional regulator|uniref:AcrR family transcriptional regulator n=1 Tax=Chelatococcus composti TaxID=1743235 RepID=A0A841KE94_9HYPH|nr:TetR/AcrR family transcriptional regulator [Chelatococcus composti]MBB6169672.1 AcrR family transcriptional regulator [Chelatococcus composti]MBS7736801.1 TetR/AcrR family transcriptional regulator [Chelatococcus composti]GGG49206.1 TetR family transcriptional regulator [Chelatococcus composti]
MAQRGRPRSFDRTTALRRAMEVFWRKGYDNASMADLTAAMGINPPSLYAAFGSKEGLFREAVALYAETEGSGIWEGVPAAPTARAAMEHLLRATALAYTKGPEPLGCLIVLGAPQAECASPAIRDDLRRRRADNVRILEERLRRAVAEGELPAHVDCTAVANFYATVQHGMSIRARDGATREELLSVADCAMAAWDRLTSTASRNRDPSEKSK